MVRRRIVSKARSYARRGASGFQGKLMTVGVGAAGAIAARLGGSVNGTFGPPLGMGAVGYFTNNQTLLTLAGMSLANGLTGSMGGSSQGSGGWF